jgi:hypothetical protein
VNVVSKILQGRNIDIDISNKMLESLLIFLRSFKQTGFENSIVTAKEICEENDIEANFKSFRLRKKKKMFNYEVEYERRYDVETIF